MIKQSLPVKDVAIHGVNSDVPGWSLPAGAFNTGFNFRISNGFIEAVGSGNYWADIPNTDDPGLILYVNSTSGKYWIIACDISIYAFDGNDFNDITPAAITINDKDAWVGCLLTNIPIINNPSEPPFYWPIQSPGTLLETLPWDDTQTWADVNESCRIMRSHKQFLFAMDLQSGTSQITDGVRWSSPADIGSIPESWDHLDPTNVAGLTNLGGDGGRIIDGLSLRDAFVIYRENGISVFDYVGGQFVWQIRHMSISTGLISADSITEVKGTHFFIGDGDLYSFDGNRVQSIIHGKMKDLFRDMYNPDTYSNSYTIHNEGEKEVWFCIPTKGGYRPDGTALTDSEYPNAAFVFNWHDQSWGVRQIEEAPFGSYGPEIDNGPKWDDTATAWDSMGIATWDPIKLFPLSDTVVTAAVNGADHSLRFEDRPAVIDADNSPYSMVLLRSTLQISEEPANTTIQSIYPSFQVEADAGSLIEFRLGSHDTPIKSPYSVDEYADDAAVRWKPVDQFILGRRKYDRKTTGDYHAFYMRADMYRDDGGGIIRVLKYSGHVVEYVENGAR